MKRIALTILLILFTLYANGSPVAWVIYAFQADSIAAAYCVNPGVPSCHGKCHINTVSNEGRKGSPPQLRVMLEKSLPAPFAFTTFPHRTSADDTFPQPDGPITLNGHPAPVDHPPLSRS